MGNYKSSEVLSAIFQSLYAVAGRRTTKSFAATVIGSIIKTLETRYEFLKYVRIDEKGQLIEDKVIAIAPEIDNVEPEKIGKAIEAIVRVVYMDIIGKAGLFFVTELKRVAGEEIISELKNFDVDLAALQIEQHYLHRSRERKKAKAKARSLNSDVSLLGYSWKNVASWKYDPNQKTCVLYNKDDEVLDNLHLDTIIENYVKDLSESLEELPEELKEKTGDISDKELELLEMLRTRDMDAETAMTLLHVSKEEFTSIVKKLLENELLQYTSYNIIELTELGISYLFERNEKVKVENKPVSEKTTS
jgi:hypothetical protein